MNTLAVKIDAAIRANRFSRGEILPAQEALLKEFGGTAEELKCATGDLVYEGVLERIPTDTEKVRVKVPYLWDIVTGNHSFTNEAKKRGQKPGNRILTFETRRAWPQVMKRLQLEAGEDVLVMERLLFAGERTVGLEFSYMPAKFFQGMTREMFEGGQSTFKVMAEKGLIPDKAVDEVSVATLEEREAALLGLDAGVPVLIRFRVTLSPEGIPIKGSRAIYLFKPGYELKI
ncbi:MAG: GntR family transcriptional regulator [Clostridia bacterium]|nr:GntR family transcriptional regulator [Clostridia bacterium]